MLKEVKRQVTVWQKVSVTQLYVFRSYESKTHFFKTPTNQNENDNPTAKKKSKWPPDM